MSDQQTVILALYIQSNVYTRIRSVHINGMILIVVQMYLHVCWHVLIDRNNH